jgi:hypothetical protein
MKILNKIKKIYFSKMFKEFKLKSTNKIIQFKCHSHRIIIK